MGLLEVRFGFHAREDGYGARKATTTPRRAPGRVPSAIRAWATSERASSCPAPIRRAKDTLDRTCVWAASVSPRRARELDFGEEAVRLGVIDDGRGFTVPKNVSDWHG